MKRIILTAPLMIYSALIFGQDSLHIDTFRTVALSENFNEIGPATLHMDSVIDKSKTIVISRRYDGLGTSFPSINPDIDKPKKIPLSMMFHKVGENSLNSFTYGYGAHYAIAGLGTYYMVHSGIDWEWSNIATRNRALTYSGIPFGALGFIVPIALPLGLYLRGRSAERTDYQITGLALGQAAMLGLVTSSAIKVFTGRRHPEIMNPLLGEPRDTKDFSGDFAFGFMERGVFDGWPSSHTAVISAMAVTLAELYPDNVPLKIMSYSYAALTAFGMSVTVHWASDVFAGALMGYSIGRSVGRTYRGLLPNNGNNRNSSGMVSIKNLSFDILPYGFSLTYSIK